jgi:tetratricopeptide (TPR) repeat protein
LWSFDRVIKQDPSFTGAFYNKGYALHQLGKYDEALDAFYRAIELDQNYVLAWNGKGHALKALGRKIESDAAVAEAKKLDNMNKSYLIGK